MFGHKIDGKSGISRLPYWYCALDSGYEDIPKLTYNKSTKFTPEAAT